MDESKRENKSKRIKSEVKNAVSSYLQKRNYCLLRPFEITKNQQFTYYQIENEVARSNSLLYSSSNSDPAVIDQNFTKFVVWLNEQKENKLCIDLDQMIAPLFCHFYIEILNGGHKEKANHFFRTHLSSFDRSNCDPIVNELLNLFHNEAEINDTKELFRSKKTVIDLSSESLDYLKSFVLENCHVVFLQVLQNWFEFRVPLDSESELTDSELIEEPPNLPEIEPLDFGCNDLAKMTSEEPSRIPKIQNVLQAIAELKVEPIPVFCVTISRTKNFVLTGVLRRQAGLVAFAEENVLNIMPLNSLDNLLNVIENVERVKFTDHKEKIYSIDISCSNTLLATGSSDHTACIYDLNDMKLLHRYEGHLGPVYVVKISQTNDYLVTGSADQTCRLWDLAKGTTLRVFVAHNGPVLCLDFHPNNLYVATGSSDTNIRMWCLIKAVTLRLFHDCKANVLAVSFSPKGKYLASASEDKMIRIWDLLTSKSLLELRCDRTPIYRLIWDNSGRELCAGSIDATVRVWDLGEMLDSDWESGRQIEPIVTRKLKGRLLNLEYDFGTYAAITAAE